MGVSSISSLSGVSTPAPAPAPSAPPSRPSVGPSTIVSISEEANSDEDAKALAEFLASGPGVSLKMVSVERQSEAYDRWNQAFAVQPKVDADKALRSVNSELSKIQHRIENGRPSMLDRQWDFVLKDNKIQVVNDNLGAADRQWLENTLNRSKELVSAVQDFYGAVVKFYDHTEEHTRSTLRSSGEETGVVIGAAAQINGKLAVRDMMSQSIASLKRPSAYISADKERPFQNSIELSASYFKFVNTPKFRENNYDMSDPDTAKYIKDHPNLDL